MVANPMQRRIREIPISLWIQTQQSSVSEECCSCPSILIVFSAKYALAESVWCVLAAVGMFSLAFLNPKNVAQAIDECDATAGYGVASLFRASRRGRLIASAAVAAGSSSGSAAVPCREAGRRA